MINCLCIGVLLMNSVYGKVAKATTDANVKLTSNQDNTCFYGTGNDLIAILNNVIADFEAGVGIASLTDLTNLKNFATDLGALWTKLDADNLTEADITAFVASYNTYISQAAGLANIADLINNGKFFKILRELQGILNNLFETYPFYTAGDAELYLEYVLTVSYLTGLADKTKCVDPVDIDIFDDLKFDLNQETVRRRAAIKDTYTLTHQVLRKRFNIAFWYQIDIEKLHNNGNKLTLLSFSNNINGQLSYNSIELVFSPDTNETNIVVKILGQETKFKILSACDDRLFITFAIEKAFENYNLQISVRQYYANRRDHLSTVIDASHLEGATVRLSVHVDILWAVVVNFIKCSNDQIELQQLELQLISQFQVDFGVVEAKHDCTLPPFCLHINKKKECTECDSEHVLHNGKCKDTCPPGTYENDKRECKDCDKSCKTCSDAKTCITCPEGKVLDNGKCKDECPKDKWPVKNDDGQDECKPCGDDCAKCKSEDKCVKCKTGFLYQEHCIPTCPTGTYPVYNPNKCIECPEGCKECTFEEHCTVCDQSKGYYYKNGKCVKDCGDGYFENTATGTCDKCIDHCKVCNDNSTCETCDEGFQLINKKCVPICGPGFTLSSTGVCISCSDKIPHCLECDNTSATTCTKCDGLTYLETDGTCVENCKKGEYADENRVCRPCPDHCDVCPNGSSCTTCEEKYLMMPDTTCVDGCPPGYYDDGEGHCIKCTQDECVHCPNGTCTECKEPKPYLEDGVCKAACEKISWIDDNKVCHPCGDHCLVCDVNGCITCDVEHGWYLLEDGTCTECLDGYLPEQSICKPCDPTCETCLEETSTCTKCIFPNALYGTECKETCPPGTYYHIIVNGEAVSAECVDCSEHCLECNETGCTKCDSANGYNLKPDGTCGDCADGYYNDAGVCKPCTITNCLKCTSETNCTDCAAKFHIGNSGLICVPICDDGEYLDVATNSCKPCTPPCSTCVDSPTKCLSCVDKLMVLRPDNTCKYECDNGDFVNSLGDCVTCTLPNCLTCSSNYKDCIECKDTFFLFNKQCVPKCEDGYRENSETKTCDKCKDSHCVKCPDNVNICTECDWPKTVLFNGECKNKCPSGYVEDGKGGCKKCPDECKECLANGDCTSCPIGSFLYDKHCGDCPSGYYGANDGTCKPCKVDHCDICINNGNTCTKCKASFWLYKNKCDVCPEGTRKKDNFTCEDCTVDDCVKCDANKNTCEKCKDGEYLYKNKCGPCPTGTFIDGLKCTDCDLHCDKCENKNSCIKCETGYYLEKDGTCVKKCADGEIPINGKCKDCTAENCKECVDNDTTKCKTCLPGFYYNPKTKKCVSPCPDGTFKSDATGRCEDCDESCKTCSNANSCDKCPNGKVLNPDGSCKDNCPDKWVRIGDECVKCKTGVECKKCSSEDITKCIECQPDKFHFEDDCIDECPKGYRPLPNKTCKECDDENCEKCTKDECIKCYKGYHLKNGKCVQDCGAQYVGNNGECNPCPKNCDVCLPNGECVSCEKGKFKKLSNGSIICVEDCGDHYWSDGTHCHECHCKHCKKCSHGSDCQKCDEPYFLQHGNCVDKCEDGYVRVGNDCKKCKDKDCLKCDAVDNCTKCNDHTVLKNGDCIEECPGKHYDDDGKCKKCEDDDCEECPHKFDKCEKCKGDKVPDEDGKCIEKCKEGWVRINGKCKKCENDRCHTCFIFDTTKCKKCRDGRVLTVDQDCDTKCPDGQYKPKDDDDCRKCPCECKTCDHDGNCTSCHEHFELKNGRCVHDCDDGEIRDDDGKCVKCDDKHCKKCTKHDKCIECDGQTILNPITGKCEEKCPKNHYRHHDHCEPCPPGCNNCNNKHDCDDCKWPKVMQGDNCVDDCDDGWVNIDGICKKCTVEHCDKCKSKKLDECDKCQKGWYKKDGKCIEDCHHKKHIHHDHEHGDDCEDCKDPHCEKCDDDECKQCEEGWYLKHGKCVKDCEKGYNHDHGKCEPCDIHDCDECPIDKSKCHICKDYKYKHYCVENCPKGTYPNDQNVCVDCTDEHCTRCSNALNCTQCEKGYVLFYNRCLPACPDGTIENTTHDCEECKDKRCKSCNFPCKDKCNECKIGFYLYEDECVCKCPVGTYPITEPLFKCLPCDHTCKECKDASTCIECKPHFELKDGKCVQPCGKGNYVDEHGNCKPCDDAHCLVCAKDKSSCDDCKPPRVTYNGKCKDECPDNYYNDNYHCKPCNGDCEKCENLKKCNDCKYPKFLFNNACVTDCPPHYVKKGKTCVKCDDDDCLECKDDKKGSCEDCEHLFLHKGECVHNCPLGTFTCTKTKKCIPCKDNCDLCPDQKSCQVCKKDYIMQDGQCVINCKPGWIPVDGECKKCNKECKTCKPNNADKCETCDYIMYEERCIDNCPPGTFKTTVNNVLTCRPCSSNCKTCETTADNCTSCKDKLVLENGKCINKCKEGEVLVNGECKRCTDPKCKVCSSYDLDECYECKDDFFVDNKKCVNKCPNGKYYDKDSKKCEDCKANCKKCTSKDNCTECKNGFYPYLTIDGDCQKCEQPYQVIDGYCQPCGVDKCLKCKDGSTKTCEQCEPKLYLVDGQCLPECVDGYTDNSNLCHPCDPSCKTCIDDSKCTGCKTGEKLQGDKCVPECDPGYKDIMGICFPCEGRPVCLDCRDDDLSYCTQCDGTAVLVDGKCIVSCGISEYLDAKLGCIPCPLNCYQCTKDSCIVCKANFYLDDEGKCVSPCKSGYYANADSGKCEPCGTANCDKCDKTHCIDCKDPFVLTLEGKCEATCPPGSYNDGTRHCKPCSSQCKECVDNTHCKECYEPYVLNGDVCTKNCDAGYTPKNGVCVKCEDEHCKECEVNNPGNCIKCDDTFYLLDGVCTNDCGPKKYPGEDGICHDCLPQCLKCSNGTTCDECPKNFHLDPNTKDCISDCPEAFFRDSDGKCKPCSENNCKLCLYTTVGDQCEQCQAPYILDKNGHCVTECEKGYKSDGTKCVPCPTGCAECDEDGCSSCKKQYYLHNKKCDSFCEDGFIGNCDTNICDRCHPACKTCTGAGNKKCVQCNTDFFLQGNACVLGDNCLEGFYANSLTGECTKCAKSNCKECTSSACQVCTNNYNLKNGNCVQNINIKPIYLNSIIASPALNFEEVVIEDSHNGSLLFETQEVSLWGVFDSLGTTTNKPTDKTVFISMNTPSLDILIELGVDRSDNSCTVFLTHGNNVYKVAGPSCADKDIKNRTYLFALVSVDGVGNIKLKIHFAQNGLLQSNSKNINIPGVNKLGSIDTIVALTNSSIAQNQGHRAENTFYSNSVLSSATVNSIISVTQLDKDVSCTQGDNACRNLNQYVVLTNGFNDANTILSINNTTVVKLNDFVFTSFALEFLVYDIKDTVFSLHVNYPNVNSHVNDDSIIVSVKVDVAAVDISVSNGVITIPDLGVASKWNKVIVKVSTDSQGISYSVDIKDALTGASHYSKSVDDLGASGTKLFTDALFVSSQSTLGVVIHLGDLDKITEVVPSIQSKKDDFNCNEFNQSAICLNCVAGFQLNDNDICENNNTAGCLEILDYAQIINNDIAEIDLTESVNSNAENHFFIRVRKLGFQNLTEGYSYNLISVRSGNSITNLVKETFVGGKLFVQVGNSNISEITNERDWYTIIIAHSPNTSTANIKTSIAGSSNASVSSLGPLNRLVLGDVTKEQINSEFKLALLCPKSLTTVEEAAIASEVIPSSNASCIDVNYSSGQCNECYAGKDELENCNQAAIGLGNIAIGGLRDQNVEIEERIIVLKEYIASNVNSQDYLVSLNLKFHELPQNGSVEVLRLENKTFANTDSSPALLLQIVFNFSAGVGSVVANTGSLSTPLPAVHVNAGEEIDFAVHFHYDINSANSYVAFNTNTVDNGAQSSNVSYAQIQRLQSSAVLTIFRSSNVEYFAESTGAYLIPNADTAKLSDTINAFFTNAQFKFQAPAAIALCDFVSQNGRCLRCSSGNELIDNQCLSSASVQAALKGYHVLTQGVVSTAAVSELIHNPFNKSQLNLICHIKQNYVKYNSNDLIIQAGNLRVYFVEVDGSIYINVNDGYMDNLASIGPFTNAEVSNWNYVSVIITESEVKVYFRDSASDALHGSNTVSYVLSIPDQILVSNADGSKSVANCHITEQNYGNGQKAIGAPEDKSIHCDLSLGGKCVSSDWGLTAHKANKKPVYIPNFSVNESEGAHTIDLEDILNADSSLCSRQFSLALSFSLLESNISAGNKFPTVAKFNFGVNFLELTYSKANSRQFFLNVSTYYTTLKKGVKDIHSIILPEAPENDNLVVIITLNAMKNLNVLIYDTGINYVQYSVTLDGVLDCLTSHAQLIFGSQADNTNNKVILSFKNVSFEPENAYSVSESFELAIQISRHKQDACRISNDFKQTCTECLPEYNIVADNNGDKACVPKGSSKAFSLLPVSNVTKTSSITNTYNLNAHINRFTVSVHVSNPGTIEQVGLAFVQVNSAVVVKIYSEGTNLYVSNELSSTVVEIQDVFDNKVARPVINIVVEVGLVDGYTKVHVYDQNKDTITYGSSFALGSGEINATSITVKVGYSHSSFDSWAFKAGAVFINANGASLSSDDVKLLAVNHLERHESCRTNLSNDGYETCSNRFNSDIVVQDSNNLFDKLSAVINNYENKKEQRVFSVEVDINVHNLLNAENQTNLNVLFALDNDLPDNSASYTQNDILPDVQEGSGRLSVTFRNNRVQVVTQLREVEVLDESNDLSDYKNVKVVIVVDSNNSKLYIRTYADDLTLKQLYEAKEVQGVNPDTYVFKNQAVNVKLNLSDNAWDTEDIDCEAFKIKKDHCNIENCLGCLLNQDGEKYCLKCQSGFYLDEDECKPVTQIVSNDFMN